MHVFLIKVQELELCTILKYLELFKIITSAKTHIQFSIILPHLLQEQIYPDVNPRRRPELREETVVRVLIRVIQRADDLDCPIVKIPLGVVSVFMKLPKRYEPINKNNNT